MPTVDTLGDAAALSDGARTMLCEPFTSSSSIPLALFTLLSAGVDMIEGALLN